jgi:hypothetical protein
MGLARLVQLPEDESFDEGVDDSAALAARLAGDRFAADFFATAFFGAARATFLAGLFLVVAFFVDFFAATFRVAFFATVFFVAFFAAAFFTGFLVAALAMMIDSSRMIPLVRAFTRDNQTSTNVRVFFFVSSRRRRACIAESAFVIE